MSDSNDDTDTLAGALRVVLTAWADPAVDIAAVLAIAWLATGGTSEAVAQIAVAGVTSVAVGKRYLGRGGV